jgi:adenylate cyclase
MVAKSPQNPFGYFLLGRSYQNDLFLLDSEQSPKELIEKTMQMAQKVLTLDDSLDIGHALLSISYVQRGELFKAVEEAKRAVAINPNSYESRFYYGSALWWSFMSSTAIPELQKAIRLNPKECSEAFNTLGDAYRVLGPYDDARYDDAISAYKQCLLQNPGYIYAHLGLIDIYMRRNQAKEAQAEAAELLRTNPHFSLYKYMKTIEAIWAYVDLKLIDNLRKAGLK